jgi:hypothetical protein
MTLKELAAQIFNRFDKDIFTATLGTNVPPRFVAGLIGNEAGRNYKTGEIKPEAERFEHGVFNHLIAVRDGHQKKYGAIVQADLKDASDDAIKALSTSYGVTQIMGWHCIHNLHCTIADLRNPDKHLFYTVKLLQLNGFPRNATDSRMDREMREWNSGSETGKTYHENYVPNAQQVRKYYAELEKTRVTRTLEARVVDTAQDEPLPEPPPPTLQPKTVAPAPPQSSVQQSATVTVLGIAVPTFLVALFKTMQDLISQGFIKADDVGNAVIGFITNNTKYFFILVALVIVAIILKRLYGWITVWIEMFIKAVPHWHDVTVEEKVQ